MKNPFENWQKLGKINSDLGEYQHPVEEEPKDILEQPMNKPNFFWFYLVCFVASLALVFRLLDLQVAQGAKNRYLAEGNRVRVRDIPAPRGNIYDRGGNILAKNIPSYSLVIYPADLPRDKTEREKIYQHIQDVSNININEMRNMVDKAGLFSLEPIILKESLNRDEALLMEVRYKDISSIEVTKNPTREYQIVPGLGHILGYVGKITPSELKQNPSYKLSSVFGQSGLEFTYEKLLKGEEGKEQVEVDSLGRIQRILATKDAVAGNNLYLSLDLGLQDAMAKSLGDELQSLKLTKGVAIAMNPRSGSILGLVNFPSYDNNIFSSENISQEYNKLLNDSSKPLLNRAISGLYPSGSIIKPVIAAAGLQEKVINENTTINAPAEIKVGDWTFPDWKVHGLTDVKKAIAESVNIFFYAIGGGWDKIRGLGIEKLASYLKKFGFGTATGVDLPGEEKGLIPDPQWKKKNKNEPWYIGDTYHLSIGQGDFLITPLQIVNSVSAIANKGELLKPQIVSKETDSTGKIIKEYPKEIIKNDLVDQDNLRIVREGMRQCVTDGSCRQLNDLPFTSAGKTGTAQFGSDGKTHAWFTAFAPYENPEIAIVVLIEEGGEGNAVAEPVAKQILQYYFSHKDLSP